MILVTGKGKSGSFAIRAVQLGAAIGANVIANATEADIRQADLVVLVKRPTEEIIAHCRKHSRPIVWDVVDAWPQPHGNDWDKSECFSWLQGMIATIKPAAIVAATHRMAQDIQEFYRGPVKWLPHHGRPGIHENPVRRDLKVVGYEGGGNYVSRWGAILQKECADRGIQFVRASGPEALASFDVVVGLRDHVGYAARHYKSGVKLANAHASGTPFIGGKECGYLETMTGFEYWVESKSQLTVALDWLERYETRLEIHNQFLRNAITVKSVAENYLSWLSQLRF